MKSKFILLIISALVGINYIYAQESQISFSETIFDFGTIGDKDGKFAHDFIISNNSKEPLVITRVVASCGCTSPSWTKEPIEPGKSGKITVEYNPIGNQGQITKSIRVTTNLQPENTTLFIKANVIKGNLDPTIGFPIPMGNLLFKKTPELDFGQIDKKENKTIVLEVYNNSPENFTNTFSFPSYIKIEPEVIPSKVQTALSITFDPVKYAKTGIVKDVIKASVAEKTRGTVLGSISYKAFVKENYDNLTPEQIKNSGKINLNKNSLIFTQSAKDNSAILKIANSGKSNLNIKGIQSFNPNIKFSKTNFTVKPDKMVEIKIDYPVHKLSNPELSPIIYIISDDPSDPVKEIHVIVNP